MEFGPERYPLSLPTAMGKKSFWLILVCCLGGCLDEPDCFQINNNYIGINFKKIFDGKADTVSFIGITTPSTDSTFYPITRATGIQLELNPFEDFTEFTMETIFMESFYLDLNYQVSVKFVSEDCGVRKTLSGLKVNDHTFDSLRVINPNLSNPARLNIEVYRCPRTNLLKLAFKKLMDGSEVADSVQLINVTADYPVDFFFPTSKVPTLNLPLNKNANSTGFTFTFVDGSVRELTVQHLRTNWNDYELCSNMTLFSDLLTTGSTFTQVIPVRDSIQDPPITNFAIYK